LKFPIIGTEFEGTEIDPKQNQQLRERMQEYTYSITQNRVKFLSSIALRMKLKEILNWTEKQ
ncbi:hypothetical protein P4E94_19940, partial [Pontiellaceae bacterium B12219]|nr:hypothetical protein [Pontiellaceae bacterium B12219]